MVPYSYSVVAAIICKPVVTIHRDSLFRKLYYTTLDCEDPKQEPEIRMMMQAEFIHNSTNVTSI